MKRTVEVCDAPPGEGCGIGLALRGACLKCQLEDAKGEAGLVNDQLATFKNRILRAQAFEGSEVERQRLEVEVEGWAKRIAALVKACGREEICLGGTCDATIYFITTKKGKQSPYDLNGTTHFATCPDSATFQRGKK